MVPEPEDPEAIAGQTSVPFYIFLPVHCMLAPIQFDDQPGLKGNKIHDIIFDGLLPPEFYAFNLSCPEVAPQDSFRVGGIASEGFGV